MAYLGNPARTKEVLSKYNMSAKKKFGQNFLIDSNVLNGIVDASGVTKDDCVLEIGPGIGSLTQYLAEAAKRVIAVEIDKSLIPILDDTLSEYDNVTVINEDILKVDIDKIIEEYNDNKKIKVVANLPYYITTPIIMKLFESGAPIESVTVMVQKEVADRMSMGPGNKDYGSLYLAVGFYASAELVMDVPPSSFIPQPGVGSAVVHLNHNGNIRIPFTKYALFKYNGAKKYDQDYYTINNTKLYISSGLGTHDGFRLFCRPSINFFRISTK